jgi:hypothetical protein
MLKDATLAERNYSVIETFYANLPGTDLGIDQRAADERYFGCGPVNRLLPWAYWACVPVPC